MLTAVEGHKAFSLTIKGDAAGWSSEADVNVLDVEIENRLGTVSAMCVREIELTVSLSR